MGGANSKPPRMSKGSQCDFATNGRRNVDEAASIMVHASPLRSASTARGGAANVSVSYIEMADGTLIPADRINNSVSRYTSTPSGPGPAAGGSTRHPSPAPRGGSTPRHGPIMVPGPLGGVAPMGAAPRQNGVRSLSSGPGLPLAQAAPRKIVQQPTYPQTAAAPPAAYAAVKKVVMIPPFMRPLVSEEVQGRQNVARREAAAWAELVDDMEASRSSAVFKESLRTMSTPIQDRVASRPTSPTRAPPLPPGQQQPSQRSESRASEWSLPGAAGTQRPPPQQHQQQQPQHRAAPQQPTSSVGQGETVYFPGDNTPIGGHTAPSGPRGMFMGLKAPSTTEVDLTLDNDVDERRQRRDRLLAAAADLYGGRRAPPGPPPSTTAAADYASAAPQPRKSSRGRSETRVANEGGAGDSARLAFGEASARSPRRRPPSPPRGAAAPNPALRSTSGPRRAPPPPAESQPMSPTSPLARDGAATGVSSPPPSSSPFGISSIRSRYSSARDTSLVGTAAPASASNRAATTTTTTTFISRRAESSGRSTSEAALAATRDTRSNAFQRSARTFGY